MFPNGVQLMGNLHPALIGRCYREFGFSAYVYGSSHLCPHAADRRHGKHRLRSLVTAGGQIREEVGEPDFTQHSDPGRAKSCSPITALGPAPTVMSS